VLSPIGSSEIVAVLSREQIDVDKNRGVVILINGAAGGLIARLPGETRSAHIFRNVQIYQVSVEQAFADGAQEMISRVQENVLNVRRKHMAV
jgi:hypothetical protein